MRNLLFLRFWTSRDLTQLGFFPVYLALSLIATRPEYHTPELVEFYAELHDSFSGKF